MDDTKRYELPESQVILLDLPESSKKLSKGDSIYAVYPDTTAFYLATVSQVSFFYFHTTTIHFFRFSN